jgi:hypothetical protein
LKTQIITLESHDDLISVRERMTWAKTPRILLVWPKYEKVSLRILDLKVLQRHADSLGAQLGLVTRLARVRRDAESLSIPVFESTTAAQRDLWPVPASKSRRAPRAPRRDLRALRESVRVKEAAWRASLAGRMIAFSAGVLAVLAVAGLFVPRAAVTLYPESQVQSVVIPIRASDSVESVSLTGDLPARETKVLVSAEGSLAIASEISAPKSKAKGVARFTNLSQADVKIPAGTIVLSSGEAAIRFKTLHETNLPAGPDQFVDVPIEAIAAGAQGNVDAEAISAVEGPLGLTVAVTNPEPTRGGSDIKIIGPSESDRARIRSDVMADLRREAEIKLRAALAEGDILLPDTLEILEVTSETYDPAEGQPGKTLTLMMEAEFSARYVSGDDLNQLALASLDASLPAGFIPSAPPAIEPLAKPVTNAEGVTRFSLSATRTLLRRVDFAEVFTRVRGRAPASAREALGDLPARAKAEIELAPSWWPWMPLIPFNVAVETR